MRTRLVAVVASLALAAPAVAGNQEDVELYLLAASRLYESLEYERALEQLQRARALTPNQDAASRICLYEGMIYADMGDRREQSTAAFKAGLALRPDAKLPLKVSPKVEREFEVLRKQMAQELARTKKTVGTTVASDRPVAVTDPGRAKPTLQPSRPGLGPSPSAAASSPLMGPSEGSLPLVPVALGGAAILSGIGGTVFGLMTNSARIQSENAAFQDASFRFHEDAVQWSMVANGFFIGCGVTALGAVASYFLFPN